MNVEDVQVVVDLNPEDIQFIVINEGLRGADGQTRGAVSDLIQITSVEMTNQSATLSKLAVSPESAIVAVVGSIIQENGVDFTISGNVISWAGLGLQDLLQVGDTLIVHYVF